MREPLRALVLTCAALGALILNCGEARAQAPNGRGDGKPIVTVSYYKIEAGRQDEWLALYKKYHRPIVQYLLDSGAMQSSKLYAAVEHAPGQPWDFAIINTTPPEGRGPPAALARGEIIRKLFPDIDDYARGEKARWALTVDHWDDRLHELDINEEPLSVYYPIVPPRK